MLFALTAGLAGVLALAAYAGAVVLVLAVGLVQGLLIAGWHRSLRVPGAVGGMVVAGAASAAADVLLWLRDDPRPLTPATGVLGLTVAGAFLHQLTRRPPRHELTASLTATISLAVLGVLTALYIAAEGTRGGASLVAVVALAAGAARLVDLLPLPALLRLPPGLLLAGAIGFLLGGVTTVDARPGLLLGLAAGAAAQAAGVLVRRTGAADLYTAGALPIAIGGPVAYVLGRILVG